MGTELTFETAVGADRWKLPRYTLEQVLSLPVTMDIVDAARAWGLSRSTTYDLARQDALPFPAIRTGPPPTGGRRAPTRYQVRRADLLESLGIEDLSARAAGPGPGAGGLAKVSG